MLLMTRHMVNNNNEYRHDSISEHYLWSGLMFTPIWQTKTNITINKGGKSFAIENYVNLTRVREMEKKKTVAPIHYN